MRVIRAKLGGLSVASSAPAAPPVFTNLPSAWEMAEVLGVGLPEMMCGMGVRAAELEEKPELCAEDKLRVAILGLAIRDYRAGNYSANVYDRTRYEGERDDAARWIFDTSLDSELGMFSFSAICRGVLRVSPDSVRAVLVREQMSVLNPAQVPED